MLAAGDVATAAAWNVLTNDVIDLDSRLRVFTTEAARDAAITSPTEGMIVYLTAPTVPAATGATTAIPTGIRTVYNGSVWVCVTPIIAMTNNNGSTTSTSYTATLTSGGTNPSVTLVTGTTARVMVTASQSGSSIGNTGKFSVAISGASTVAANDNWGAQADTVSINFYQTSSAIAVISGLTAGTNTFTLNYLISSNTGFFSLRNICVEGIA